MAQSEADAQAIGADSSLGDRVVSGVVPKDGDILWNGSDVIVVGAGVSGLSAACELASEGLCVTVLEASSRVGGRLLQVYGVPGYGLVDMGGELLEAGEDTILQKLVQENQWKSHPAFVESMEKSSQTSHRQMFYHSGMLDFDDGVVFKTVATAWASLQHRWDLLVKDRAATTTSDPSILTHEDHCLSPAANENGHVTIGTATTNGQCLRNGHGSGSAVETDCSVVDLLRQDSPPPPVVVLDMINCTLCQRDGVELSDCSVAMECSSWEYDEVTTRLNNSYYVLLKYLVDRAYGLRDRLHIELNSAVESISYNEPPSCLHSDKPHPACVVRTADGRTYSSFRSALVTVPLSILKQESIVFEPPLPAYYTESIKSMTMGGCVKIYLTFGRQWWPQEMGILYAHGGFVSQYWVGSSRRLNSEDELPSIVRQHEDDEDAAALCTPGCGLPLSHQSVEIWRQRLLPIAGASCRQNGRCDSLCLSDVGVIRVSPSDIGLQSPEETSSSLQGSMNTEHRCSSSNGYSLGGNNDDDCLHSLFGFVTGSWAEEVGKSSPSEAVHSALKQLNSMFGNRYGNSSQPASDAFHCALICDWSKQEHIRGGYSAPTVNSRRSRAQLAKPINNRLYFAGEHTHQQLTSVDTAMETGFRAAKQILSTL